MPGNSHDHFVPVDTVPANDAVLGKKKLKLGTHEPTASSPPRLEDEHSWGEKRAQVSFDDTPKSVFDHTPTESRGSGIGHRPGSIMSFRFPIAYYDETRHSYIDSSYGSDRRHEEDENLHWRQISIFVAMCVLYMASSLTSSCFGILLTDLSSHFSVGNHILGVMSAMITLGYALVQPFAGLIVLILGPWKSVVVSSVISISGNIGFGLSHHYRTAEIFRLWTGLGCGMVYGIVWWFIKSEISPDKFGKLSATLETSNALGTVLATLPVYFFAQVAHWTSLFSVILPFIVFAGGFVASYLLLPYKTQLELSPISILSNETKSDSALKVDESAETVCDKSSIHLSDIPPTTVSELEIEKNDKRVSFVAKEPKCVEMSPVPERNEGSVLSSNDHSELSVTYHGTVHSAWITWKSVSKDILCCGNEWGAFIIGFAVLGSMDALGFTWLVTVLEHMHGLTYEESGVCVMVSNMMVIPVIFGAGILSDSINRRLPFVCIGIFFAMLHIIFLAFFKLTFCSAIFVCALNGTSQGFTSTIYAFAAENLSAKHTEQAVAWNQLFYMGGVACMTSIIGVIIENHSSKMGCIAVLLVLVCSCIPIPFLRETHGTFRDVEK